MVILVVCNSFNVVKSLQKPDLVAHQKPPFYTTNDPCCQRIQNPSEVSTRLHPSLSTYQITEAEQ